MSDDLVPVHEAQSLLEAQLLKDRLDAAGIGCFIDNTDSPLDGLTAADQVMVVRVLPKDVAGARQVVTAFVAEHPEGDPGSA